MAIDTSVPRTRRALLAGGLGGLVAVVASALGRPLPTSAADDSPVILGHDNTETQTTVIVTSGTANAFVAQNAAEPSGALCAGDTGVSGDSGRAGGLGVWGRSTGNGTGVFGWSQLVGTEFGFKPPVKTGVHGRAIQDASSRGVTGETTAGRGVNGIATTGAAGYFATTDPTKGCPARSAGWCSTRAPGWRTDRRWDEQQDRHPGHRPHEHDAVVATSTQRRRQHDRQAGRHQYDREHLHHLPVGQQHRQRQGRLASSGRSAPGSGATGSARPTASRLASMERPGQRLRDRPRHLDRGHSF
jgi:hypothetical protein